MSPSHTITKTDLPRFAAELIASLSEEKNDTAVVLALQGDLGAGKTTLVQHLAAVLGVSEQVTSPTFTIMKHYETESDYFTDLVHMDAYRIETLDELTPLRFKELLDTPRVLLCIEWAERIKEALPEGITVVTLTPSAEESRTVQVTTW